MFDTNVLGESSDIMRIMSSHIGKMYGLMPYVRRTVYDPQQKPSDEAGLLMRPSAMGNRLSYEETVEVALDLLRAGQNPSATKVIETLGRGSKTTAVKHLEQWRETLQARGFRLPPGLPEGLIAPLERFWFEAVQMASTQLEFERLAYVDAHERIQSQLEERQSQIAAQAEDLAETQRQLKECDGRRSALEVRVEDLLGEQSRLLSRIANLERVAELEKAESLQRIAELNGAWDARLREQTAQSEEIRKQLEFLQNLYDASEKRWLLEVDSARTYARDKDQVLAREQERYRRERDLSEQLQIRLRDERDRAQLALQVSGEKFEDERNRLMEALRKAEQTIHDLDSRYRKLEERLLRYLDPSSPS